MDDGEPETAHPAPRRSITDMRALAAEHGIGRIHILAWRDLADVEAGGSELHASTVAAHWAEAGIEVLMRTSHAQGTPPETVRDGYAVVRRAGRYLVFPRAAVAELAGRHGRRDALVEIWNGVPFFTPLWARGPVVTWLHHVHEEMWPLVLPPGLARAGQFLERQLAPPLYRRRDIVTLSESSRRSIVERLRLRGERVNVVPPGIDRGFTPGHEGPVPLVLAVGRLMPSKDFPALIRAVHEVRRQVPTARLRIIGEGYERERIQRVISDLDAGDWCELAGRVDDRSLREAYHEAWVVASTSRAEGWGMTLTEAAASGTPAVATRIAGHVDAVVDGRTGVLFDTHDELVAALAALLTDDSRRRRLSAAARTHGETFSWARTAYDNLAVLTRSVAP